MEIEIVYARSNKPLVTLQELSAKCTILEVKEAIAREKRKYCDVNRQELRLEPAGKALQDQMTLSDLDIKNGALLYFKDRGFQIGWSTVFLAEYAGPLLVYLWVHSRPWLLYGDAGSADTYYKPVVQLALGCWTFHYMKRLVETICVHRFSNATMPITNLFKNCAYYWGFAGYVAYYVNHPLYTSPSNAQVYAAFVGFAICELGNFSIHWLLRNLRPVGSKVRKIPYPTSNPLTLLFKFVSCPNYTYEFGAWICFSIMTQCLPAGIFSLIGAYQMTMWALGKHRNYKKEFKSYPKSRKAIFPFIL